MKRLFYTFLFCLFVFNGVYGEEIIKIISSPNNFVNKTVSVSGNITKLVKQNSNTSKYYYLRGKFGGVVLVYAPGRVNLSEGNEYDIFGIVGYNVDYNEPFIIVSSLSQKQSGSGNNSSTSSQRNLYQNNSAQIQRESEPEVADDSVTSFLKNSRISEYLLDQLGTQIIRIIHFTCSHSSTRLVSRRGDDLVFETEYKGLMKKHKLVWKVVLSDTTIISDFSFLSDTNSFPSARFVNQVKNKVVEIIKSSFR